MSNETTKANTTENYFSNVSALLIQAHTHLQFKEWKKAIFLFDKIIAASPDVPDGYLGRLLATLKLSSEAELATCGKPYTDLPLYATLLEKSDVDLYNRLKGYEEASAEARASGKVRIDEPSESPFASRPWLAPLLNGVAAAVLVIVAAALCAVSGSYYWPLLIMAAIPFIDVLVYYPLTRGLCEGKERNALVPFIVLLANWVLITVLCFVTGAFFRDDFWNIIFYLSCSVIIFAGYYFVFMRWLKLFPGFVTKLPLPYAPMLVLLPLPFAFYVVFHADGASGLFYLFIVSAVLAAVYVPAMLTVRCFKKKKVAAVISAVVGVALAFAVIYPFLISPLTYEKNGDGYTLTGTRNPVARSANIPEQYRGLPVTAIGDHAFASTYLIDVTIPDTVKSIGNSAFAGANLWSLTIPVSVTSIGDWAFHYHTVLRGGVTIPDGVTRIGEGAFEHCEKLDYVVIPASVKSIGRYAFNYCYQLKAVYYTGTADEFEEISIDTCNDALYGAFFYVYSESEPAVVGNFWHYVDGVPTKWFAYSEGLNYVSNGNGTCYVSGTGTCKDADIVIPEISPEGWTVTGIGDSAFRDCDSLTKVTIGNGVTSIGDSAFSGCSRLTGVTIGNGITSIGNSAFESCTSLTGVTIPDSVMSIGNYAFYGCDSLTKVAIGNGVTSIGDYAFSGCSSLTSVTIPDSVTSIGNYAFQYCDSLTSMTIPDSVTSIGDKAFAWCDRLTSVTIGNGVTSIGDNAFWDCDRLNTVYYTGTAAEWGRISINSNNSYLKNAARYYYSESEPTKSGNFWHYVDGVPMKWE